MMDPKKIAVFVGSLRKESYSRKMARALAAMAPASLALVFLNVPVMQQTEAYLSGAGQINTHGRPLNAGEGRFARYAIWKDGNRWHVRTMTRETEGRFRGAIEVRGGEFTRVTEYWVEHAGPRGLLFAGNPDRTLIRFDFASKGSIDGFDFRVKGKNPDLVFTLLAGETEPGFEPGAIFIGRSGIHPSSNPFHLPARDK